MTYNENPRWKLIFDGVPNFNDRTIKYIEKSNEDVVFEVRSLEQVLDADEDGNVDYRTIQMHTKVVESVDDALKECVSYAAQLIEILNERNDHIDHLYDMMTDILGLTDSVIIEGEAEGFVARDWAKEQLRGDWDFHVYEQKRFNPPIKVFIFQMNDDVDRLNFKMRFG